MASVLITGASSGIGMELAKVFAAHGHDLVLVARREDVLIRLAGELTATHPVRVSVIKADLSCPLETIGILDDLREKKISIDILVNNAGIGDHGYFSRTAEKRISEIVEVNIHSLTILTRLLLPAMLERKSGKIMNVASTAAFRPAPLTAVYAAAKAYVLSFTQALASELKGSGVTVTALCPGPTQTGFFRTAAIAKPPLSRGGKIAVAGDVALFGYEALMQGKVVAIHGLWNHILALLFRHLPLYI